jgi:hypothetical protein
MRRLFTLIHIFLFISAILFGQELSVQSFYLANKDLTANTPGTMVHDQNGNVCALIKVETTLKGFTFDVGVLGMYCGSDTVEIDYATGEIFPNARGIGRVHVCSDCMRQQRHKKTGRI